MTLVINTSLDTVSDVNSELGLTLALKSVIHGWVLLKLISQEVVVILKIGKSSGEILSEESSSFLGAVIFSITTTKLNPLGKGLNVGRKASGRIVGSSRSSTAGNTRFSTGNLSFDILLLLKHLFPSNKVGNTLNEDVN